MQRSSKRSSKRSSGRADDSARGPDADAAADALPRDLSARIAAALSRPPEASTDRDARLLGLAFESGVGAQALSVLVAIDVGRLSLADRVRYAQAVHVQGSWLAALGHLSVAAVAGTLDGWVEDRVDELAAEWAGDLGVEWSDGTPRDVRRDAEAPEADTDVTPVTNGRAWQVCQAATEEAWGSVERGIQAEVASALRVSERTAGRRVDEARFLVGDAPEALAHAWRGDWQTGHLRVVEDHLADLDPRLRREVLSDVSPHASIDTPGRLRARLGKSLATRDADAMADRIRRKDAERDTDVRPLPDGQAQLVVSGPAAMVTWMQKSLTVLARARHDTVRAAAGEVDRTPAETRIGYLRTDVLTESLRRMLVALHGDTAHPADSPAGNVATRDEQSSVDKADPVDPWLGPPAAGPGSRSGPEACVIVDLATALGMAEHPAWVPGQGWTPAPIAREILSRATTWRRWLTDGGRVVDTGATYRPSAEMRRRVHARDVTCTLDICNRPAQESQIDHAVTFDGANTAIDNLHSACGPHHMLLTTGEFVVAVEADGAVSWTSTRSGLSYASHPHPRHDVASGSGHGDGRAHHRRVPVEGALELMTLEVFGRAA
ncbi:MAG: hypothetical protein ACKOT0_06660 [bacterium]